MVDKFRKTIPLKITFGDGEQPVSGKLNAGFTQVRNGTNLLERAIGDVWNQGGDTQANVFPLQIPNIARYLGANSYLNPAVIPTSATFKYTESIGLSNEGKNTGYLKFPSKYGTLDLPSDFSITNPSGQFTTDVDFEYQVDSAGKYWIEKGTGKFRIYGSLSSTTKITYTVDPALDWVPGMETVPGVIPDPGQTTFTSCRIEKSGSKFYLHFPPRRPLTLSDRETPDNYPPAAEITDNEATSGGVSPKKYWQYATQALTGTGDEHYRYSLPKEIIDMGLSEGDEIPQGMMLLWDSASDTIIEDAIFKWPDSSRAKFAIEVTSATFDFDDPAIKSSDELQASYNKTGLILITCGAPVARMVWTLANVFYKHNHNNEGTLEGLVRHSDLKNLNPPSSSSPGEGDYAGHNTRYPTYLPSWAPSRWFGDDHTHLLSRGGSQGVSGGKHRDVNDNAMLGDLILASATEVGGNFLNTTGDSRKLYFHSNATGSYMYASSSATVHLKHQLGAGSAMNLIVGNPSESGSGKIGLGSTPSAETLKVTSFFNNTGAVISGSGTGLGGTLTGGTGSNGVGLGADGTAGGHGATITGGNGGDGTAPPDIYIGPFGDGGAAGIGLTVTGGIGGDGGDDGIAAAGGAGIIVTAGAGGVGNYGYNGMGTPGTGGAGLTVTAGAGGNFPVWSMLGPGGHGAVITAGAGGNTSGTFGYKGGDGLRAFGANYDGNGVVATGGIRQTGGTGGNGVVGTSGSGGGHGGLFTAGNATGFGAQADGQTPVSGTGTAGTGLVAHGGATNGHGVQAFGKGTGTGGSFTGGTGTNSFGIQATGGTNSSGVRGSGNGTGHGGDFTGGSTSGAAGLIAQGGVGGGIGVQGTAVGAFHAVQGIASSNASSRGGSFTTTISGAIGAYGGNTQASANAGAGLFGEGVACYGVIAQGDTTSPARSALRLVPQNADPSSGQQGDMYVSSVDGALKVHNGTAWSPVNDSVQIFTANGSWTKPAGAKFVTVICIGGGAGGGSGALTGVPATSFGGGGGGGGAASMARFDAAILPSSVTVTVGAAGTGGVGRNENTNGTGAGFNGTAGTTSSFGTFLTAGGGGGGTGGGAGGGTFGGGGGGVIGNGSGSTGGVPTATGNAIGAQGPSSTSGSAHGEWGGGTGGTAFTFAGSSIFGGGGGGGGGGIDSEGSPIGAGDGGTSMSYTLGGGGSGNFGGDGEDGASNTTIQRGYGGEGGGGGGWTGAAVGGGGGDGGIPGGGGAGGAGQWVNQGAPAISGSGGNGARGEVRVFVHF